MSLPRMVAAILLLLAPLPAAEAGVLVEGRLEGQPVRVELGGFEHRALVTVGGTRRLVDVASGEILRIGGDGKRTIEARDPGRGAAADGFRLRTWYRGPLVAGHATTYDVLERDGSICAEVAVAGAWMTPFLAPAVRAIDLVQRVDRRIAPKARGACGAVPFRSYAGRGWPMMAGHAREPIFVTETLRFDHPSPPEFAPAGEGARR